MSETILKFLLSEIKVVRIVCQRLKGKDGVCGGTVETRLADLLKVERCPICKEDFAGGDGKLFYAFRTAVQAAAELPADQVKVELVLPGE